MAESGAVPSRSEKPGRWPGGRGGAWSAVNTRGLYLFGVIQARGWRTGTAAGADLARVRYRDLAALVRAVPFHLPALESAELLAHQRTVEAAMRRATILPAPPGIVFQGRRALARFLEDQYPSLVEGLAFVEGHWELRLHIAARAPGEPTPELEELAVQAYAELRRLARAAVPFPRPERHLHSAAFLVQRGDWIDFVERAEDLGTARPELVFDVTGPWPPYDFVRMTP